MVIWSFVHNYLTFHAWQSRLCPCYVKFPWQPFGDLNWYAVNANFVTHVILKIIFTLFSAHLVRKSFYFIRRRFHSTTVRFSIQIIAIIFAIWLPIRVFWPHLLFLTLQLSTYSNNLIKKYVPKDYRFQIKPWPCSELVVGIIYWLETLLAVIGIFLLLAAFIPAKTLHKDLHRLFSFFFKSHRGGRRPSSILPPFLAPGTRSGETHPSYSQRGDRSPSVPGAHGTTSKKGFAKYLDFFKNLFKRRYGQPFISGGDSSVNPRRLSDAKSPSMSDGSPRRRSSAASPRRSSAASPRRSISGASPRMSISGASLQSDESPLRLSDESTRRISDASIRRLSMVQTPPPELVPRRSSRIRKLSEGHSPPFFAG